MTDKRSARGDSVAGRARRTQILDAATRVFAAKGFHRATIREIAAGAGLADGTIYLYFANKMALLLGILDRMNESEQREAQFAASTGGDVAQFVREYTRHRLATMTDLGLDALRVLLSEVLTNAAVRERYYREIVAPTFALAEASAAHWRPDGAAPPHDLPLALRAVSGMILGVLMLRLMDDPLLDAQWDAVPDVLAGFIIAGLVRTQGDSDDHNGTGTGDPPDHAA